MLEVPQSDHPKIIILISVSIKIIWTSVEKERMKVKVNKSRGRGGVYASVVLIYLCTFPSMCGPGESVEATCRGIQ